MPRFFFVLACVFVFSTAFGQAPARVAIDKAAEQYVRLGLALGEHDRDSVDAYYGPPAWREEAKHAKWPLVEIGARALSLLAALQPTAEEARDESVMRRYAYLRQQLPALAARARIVGGEKMRFDEESRVLSGVVVPRIADAEFDPIVRELDRRMPGVGALRDRVEAYRKEFVIPEERVSAVLDAAVKECRRRTLAHIELPPGERFTLEYVRGKPWAAYLWYQGNYRSVLQINVELPMDIGQAIHLACHEGYPGHHTYYALLEKNFVRDRGWMEFSFFALFSPQSLVSEGAAEFGVDLAFPDEERVAFWRDTLFPLAGLGPARALEYHRVGVELRKLSPAGIQAARRYLEGETDREATLEWLGRYTLAPRAYAERAVRFYDAYRSYIVNYALGRSRVRAYVESAAGAEAGAPRRWQAYFEMLMSRRLPAALAPK